MTSLSRIKVSVAKRVILEALSKYRHETSMEIAKCSLEVYNKEILRGETAGQEREICEELRESLYYLDALRDKIMEIKLE